MADIDKALRYEILQGTGISAAISDRVYPVNMPQIATFPLVVYQEISGKPAVKEHGNKTALPRPRFQITCWSDEFDDLSSLDILVKNAIDGRRGNWGTSTYVTTVQACQAESTPRDDRDPVTGLYSRSRDYFIMYKE